MACCHKVTILNHGISPWPLTVGPAYVQTHLQAESREGVLAAEPVKQAHSPHLHALTANAAAEKLPSTRNQLDHQPNLNAHQLQPYRSPAGPRESSAAPTDAWSVGHRSVTDFEVLERLDGSEDYGQCDQLTFQSSPWMLYGTGGQFS